MPGTTATLLTAPADQALIITDVVLTTTGGRSWTPYDTRVSVDTDAGAIAEYMLVTDTSNSGDGLYISPVQVSHAYQSGLPVPPGTTVGITNHGDTDVSYSVSGCLVQP